MASERALTTSWTLSQTATDVVGVSRGMLEAATTDNVSMLALLACEAFGSTLPMSIETKAKMHQKCSQDHQSAVLKFLKAQIGYKRGDSGWQLARSDSGLRFLGLATCLLSKDLWISSELLRELVTETAEDKVLVPNSQQLKGLLLVLQGRLASAGFMNEVLGWSILLNSKINRQCIDPVPPSNEVIRRLIKCMSSLARVGDATRYQTLKIKIPYAQAAWTIALLKWCLGIPPTVTREDGHTIIAASSSQAEVYPIINSRDDDIEISIWDDLKTVRELFQGLRDGLGHIRGMVPAQGYLEAFCQRFGPRESPYYSSAMQLIPYACHEVYHHLKIGQISGQVEHGQSSHKRFNSLKSIRDNLSVQGIEATFGSVFPDEETVLDAIRELNHEGSAYSLKKVPDHSEFSQLPPAVSVRQLFRTTCPCVSCLATAKFVQRQCDFTLWLRKISYHVGTLLLLSMVVPVDVTGVSLHYNFSELSYDTEFTSTIYECLVGRQERHCSIDAVIQALLHLVGHTDIQSRDTEAWIASSCLGQTIYPQMLQSLRIQSRGSMTVVCVPGSLSWGNVDYEWVETAAIHLFEGDISLSSDEENDGSPQQQQLKPPVSVQDEYPSPNLKWRVSPQDNVLKLSLFATNLTDLPQKNPLQALRSMTDSVFVSCPHDEHTPCSDEYLVRAAPHRDGRPRDDLSLSVIRTYRNEVMRYFSLCSPRPCVVRDQACLNCCVLVGRLLQMRVVLC